MTRVGKLIGDSIPATESRRLRIELSRVTRRRRAWVRMDNTKTAVVRACPLSLD